jgi:oxygen-independent coproporphyrinogen-3 oxidase
LYPNAPLKEAMARAQRTLPPAPHAPPVAPGSDWLQAEDDEAADMYLEGFGLAEAGGYEQYEISNVARRGHASRHNLKYWEGGQWRGFGCGAHSTVDGVRWRNISATAKYVARVDQGAPLALDMQTLSAGQRIEEALFTGLRLSAGIDRGNFVARFGVDPWPRYSEVLGPYVEDGLMWMAGPRFGLTRRGMLVANEILSTFV